MTTEDFKTFQGIMHQAADLTVMPNGKDIERTIIALFEGLKQYGLGDVSRAVSEHCRSERFFPMLADIVRRIEGSAEDRAASAWALVLKAIERFGHSDSVRFPLPAIHYAVQQMGGWRHLCRTLTNDDLPFRAKDFERYYLIGENIASWTDAEGKTRVPSYLQGEHERNNISAGYDVPRRVWSVADGRQLSESEIPALEAPKGDVKKLISQIVKRAKAADRV